MTREVADTLASISRSMEGKRDAEGKLFSPERVSAFLMRLIFTMFVEDIRMIPGEKFRKTLQGMKGNPQAFVPTVSELWEKMAKGGYSVALQEKIKHFNGGLFEDVEVLEVDDVQLELITEASGYDWARVEPSIFGTLVERALNPRERHKLGAHYTPRAYVERLVEQTVITPLEQDWKGVQVEIQSLLSKADNDSKLERARQQAISTIQAFLADLRHTTVLDPACGTGNFLYVAMELMKRLEAEVIDTLHRLGGQTPLLGVSPEQFLGLELNPRAARVAELVLWIGYLQLYVREHGSVSPPEPILKAFHNIRQQDAVLAYSDVQPRVNKDGKPVTRWDGVSLIKHPVTGREVPDPAALVQDQVYDDPRAADWPEATFIVSNPPFLGAKRLRDAFGDGYAETLRKTYPLVSESSDFVMYWWHKAAEKLASGSLRRFGFVTTNSIKQTFNRRVLERALAQDLSLAYGVPDHPWVDEADGAAVRIAMTVAEPGNGPGVLTTVTSEAASGNGAYDLETVDATGVIHADLTVGADVTSAVELRAMDGLSNRGVQLFGSGFIVTPEEAKTLGLGRREGLERHIREYRNGKDLTNRPRGVMVIDLFGLSEVEVRERYPEVYQHVLTTVKPERDQNNRASYRDNWWLFGEPRKSFRPALIGLEKFITTPVTSKHRFFTFLPESILPDDALIAIAHDDAYVLGVLSSHIHVVWALAQGARLGVGNDLRYIKTRCFETFPFPEATAAQKDTIRKVAEDLDAFRKARLAQHPKLTMTAMYNVLEQLRLGAELSAKDKQIHDQGLISTLRELHNKLDAAVADAYGWGWPLTQQEILERLMTLNTLRVAEEKAGVVRYLRPEYQAPGMVQEPVLNLSRGEQTTPLTERPQFPERLAEQAQALRQALSSTEQVMTTEQLTGYFVGAKRERVEELLEMLVGLGQVRQSEGASLAFAA